MAEVCDPFGCVAGGPGVVVFERAIDDVLDCLVLYSDVELHELRDEIDSELRLRAGVEAGAVVWV